MGNILLLLPPLSPDRGEGDAVVVVGGGGVGTSKWVVNEKFERKMAFYTTHILENFPFKSQNY